MNPRVAMLAHSTLPRGGVVHALSLSEALTARGVETVLHAPDADGGGFFRAARCETRAFPAAPAPGPLGDRVEARIAEYVAWFRRPENRGFDVYHAHDGLSGAALAQLKRERVIPGFVRTVHHLDAFEDDRLTRWQAQSIAQADELMTVSNLWRRRLAQDFGRQASVCGNGVDLARFTPSPDGREGALRTRLGLRAGPVLLSVGGVEARKNTLAMLAAYEALLSRHRQAQFVIAGGASLLDHAAYQREFCAALTAMRGRGRVILTGPIADDNMPALYRLADAFVFASVKEGFGLCVLEAMASATPVVVSRIAPFTEYLAEDEALFCDPHDPAEIATAMAAALRFDGARGLKVAARHDWRAVAQRTLGVYNRSLVNA